MQLARDLLRVVRRDPYHLPENLILLAQERLAAPSLEWGDRTREAHPDTDTGELAEQMRTEAAHFSRTNGALAGTPFLIALVPAYVSVLWEQARMVMRIAALYGRDPRDPAFASEMLALRGLYETPAAAQEGLTKLGSAPPTAGQGTRATLGSWVRLVHRVLILAGFLSGPEDDEGHKKHWIIRSLSMALGFAIYLITWILPVTFMIMMSWGCEQQTRTLGDRAILFYGEEPLQTRRGLKPARMEIHDPHAARRTIVRILLLVISLWIPLLLVTIAVAHPVGYSTLVSIAGFIGLAVVIALSARAAR
jgi:hypothetical protein